MKSCLITGGGSGIGRASAIALAQDGFAVAISGRRADALDETIQVAGESAKQITAFTCDVTDPQSVGDLFAKTVALFGRLDVLFNNAGASLPAAPLEDVTTQNWQKILDVNLTGVFLCTQEAFRVMKKQDPAGGRIINNGSISAHVPRPNAVAYNASKHAVTGLTKSSSLEGRKYNISCGQIDIGNARTEMSSTTQSGEGAMQATGEFAVEPQFDVAHVAQAVLYMANLPLGANVQFMTVMASSMPYIGRG